MDSVIIYLAPLFLITALVFAMSGQGGASVYLAIMALFGIPQAELPVIALSCNIVATVGIAYQFTRAGHLKKRLVLPFVITSVPAAFIGGMIDIPVTLFKILLISTIFLVSLKLFFWKKSESNFKTPSLKRAFIIGPVIGIVLGLLAGIIGIGGGIFLFPIILFLGWGSVKQAAVAGGLFTLVNSISGLIGHGIKGPIDLPLLIPLICVVIIGSQLGARLGARKLPAAAIQKVFAVLLFGVAVRLGIGLI